MFNVDIISTGSQGNCVVIDKHIMCDAGLSKKKVIDSGYDVEDLKVLTISHKHADHTNLPFIRWAIKKGVSVHLPEQVYVMIQNEGKLDISPYLNETVFIHYPKARCVYVFENDEGEDVTYTITTHPQKHHDIINYAFVVEALTETTFNRLLYSTDLDTVEPTDVGPGLVELGYFDTIILEGNYDELWLRDYINIAINSVDSDVDASVFTDKELDQWVRVNYREIPRAISAGLFRAVQNMRHLSKQQARIYVQNHLNPHGKYYEVHRSSMFYERPDDWETI